MTPASGGAPLSCRLRAPDPSSSSFESASADCDAEEAAADSYPFADTVTLILDAEQDRTFQERRAFFKGGDAQLVASKEDMAMTVQIGRRRPVAASGNFRGVRRR